MPLSSVRAVAIGLGVVLALAILGNSRLLFLPVIVAGFVLFHEMLPLGIRALLQIAAFTFLVASAVALGHQQAPRSGEPPAALT